MKNRAFLSEPFLEAETFSDTCWWPMLSLQTSHAVCMEMDQCTLLKETECELENKHSVGVQQSKKNDGQSILLPTE